MQLSRLPKALLLGLLAAATAVFSCSPDYGNLTTGLGKACIDTSVCPAELFCHYGNCDDQTCEAEGESRDCFAAARKFLEPQGVACRAGKQTCTSGRWTACVGSVVPNKADLCGDGRDDDCEGRVDQGCGPGYTYIRVDDTKKDPLGREHRQEQSREEGDLYRFEYNKVFASDHVLAVGLLGPDPGSLCWFDHGGIFAVHGFQTGGDAARPRPFSAVVPSDGVWGLVVDGSPVKGRSSGGEWYANPGPGTGRYRIEIKGYKGADKQPIFLTPYFDGKKKREQCLLTFWRENEPSANTFQVVATGADGTARECDFSFWLPDPAKALWIRLDSTGKVSGGNDFERKLVSSADGPGLARITGAGINTSRTAVLVTAVSKGGYAASHRFEMGKVRVDFLDTGNGNGKPRFPQHSYVLFVH